MQNLSSWLEAWWHTGRHSSGEVADKYILIHRRQRQRVGREERRLERRELEERRGDRREEERERSPGTRIQGIRHGFLRSM